MLGNDDFSAEGRDDKVWRDARLDRVIKCLKGDALWCAEYKRDSAEKQRHKAHCDDLLAQLVDMTSPAKDEQINEHADYDAGQHPGKHTDPDGNAVLVQQIRHDIAAKGRDCALREVCRGGGTENNRDRESGQRRDAHAQQ